MSHTMLDSQINDILAEQYNPRAEKHPEELSAGYDLSEATIIATGPSMRKITRPKEPEEARGAIILVNSAGNYWLHKADFWISRASRMFPGYIYHRYVLGFPMKGITYIGYDRYPNVNNVPLVGFSDGSASLVAVGVAEALGFKKVYLYGVDLVHNYERFRSAWEKQSYNIEIVQCEGADPHHKITEKANGY